MKKLITIVAVTVLALSSLQAQGQGQGHEKHMKMKQMYALKHANPLPNLMRVAKNNKDSLGLSKEQLKAMKAWASVKKPEMKAMVQKVMHLEKALAEEALTTDNDLTKKGEEILDVRREIMAMKNACRANLKTILSPSQYTQVVTLYKENRAHRKAKK